MGWLSFFGLGPRKTRKPTSAANPAQRKRSPARQQMEAEILANMRKIRQNLAQAKDSPFNGATEEQIMAGLRRWTEEQKLK